MNSPDITRKLSAGLVALDRFGTDLTACLSEAIENAGLELREAAAERTPVATGALRASLGCGPVALSGDDRSAALSVMVGSPLSYASVVEFGRTDGSRAGHHMVSTALEQSGPAIATLIELATVRALHGLGEGA